jgi:glycosyltransferase involved in cell wall biosynthesis
MNAAISIIIPAYNVQDYVAEAISSALSQTLQHVEVIVVDDGSTDETANIVRAFNDPRLKLVRQANGGLSAARNTGLRYASAKYIGFLDADDRWHPDKARQHLAVMEVDPTIGLTFSHSAYIDERGTETGRTLFSLVREPSLKQMILRNHVGNGSSPIVRYECFTDAGSFDEALRSCEDWEMWVRILRDTCFRARLIPGILTYYRINTRSLSMNFDGFVRYAELAAAKIRKDTPQVSSGTVNRGLAMIYRIAGTKAFGNSDKPRASTLLVRAIAISPRILVTDPRFIGTVAAMFFPLKLVNAMHGALGYCLRKTTRS